MPDPDPLAEYAALFEPRTVAVIGASSSGTGPANNFIRHLKAMGFTGPIYPIHREATEIEGLPVCPSLAETPEPVDYAYVAVAAERVADEVAPPTELDERPGVERPEREAVEPELAPLTKRFPDLRSEEAKARRR